MVGRCRLATGALSEMPAPKITTHQVREIRKLWSAGLPVRAIATRVKLGHGAIYRALGADREALDAMRKRTALDAAGKALDQLLGVDLTHPALASARSPLQRLIDRMLGIVSR